MAHKRGEEEFEYIYTRNQKKYKRQYKKAAFQVYNYMLLEIERLEKENKKLKLYEHLAITGPTSILSPF